MRGKGRQGDVKSWLEVTVYLRAGKRTDCSCGQALEAEGFELLRSAQKGTPYGEYLITKASRQLI